MTDVTTCPECSSYDTECVHTDFWDSEILRVMVCNDCPTEWSLFYANPIVRDVNRYD